ncbi:M20 family metallopeptidase [Bacillus sp. S/N-304-OC-R1]|uniref:M20 metallopeptidase family protein n=1 Tax=Bacillus sp. S/N-304-OC-R1 TaxID=2758034 RepID=UPI001C8EBE48|nr:amidohydrolase [Bacillus sp. S/N-304-OC-R1]MBY0123555.1 amidohydrolase [Bacillus sp. S/N-304-OC-R1]
MEKKNLELAIQLRHELHAHPELSNHEVWTKQHLINFLKENTSLEIVDRGRWFYAIYHSKAGNRNVAFRADFDALPIEETIELPYGSQFPGVSHKCGHDGHSATLCGLALEIDQKGSDNNIFFLFQHAEETGDGAAECAVFIKENNIDEIFAYHNMSGFKHNVVHVIDGTAHFASKGMTILMEGVPSHASEPEKGINPSFAIAKVIDAIPEFTSKENNEGDVLCTVVQVDIGAKAFGVNASKGALRMTIRALYEKEMDKLQKNLEDLAKSEAEKYGLKVAFEYQDEFPETANDKESSDKIREVCKEKGIPMAELAEAFRGSEDFGHFTKLTKGSYCYVGNGENYPNLHSYEYDFKDDIIETAVEVFKGLAKK